MASTFLAGRVIESTLADNQRRVKTNAQGQLSTTSAADFVDSMRRRRRMLLMKKIEKCGESLSLAGGASLNVT
jgi:hypothetical protein